MISRKCTIKNLARGRSMKLTNKNTRNILLLGLYGGRKISILTEGTALMVSLLDPEWQMMNKTPNLISDPEARKRRMFFTFHPFSRIWWITKMNITDVPEGFDFIGDHHAVLLESQMRLLIM